MAGTTHLLAAVWHRSATSKKQSVANAQECVSFLRHVAESWPAAGHKADILEALVLDYADPSTGVVGSPVTMGRRDNKPVVTSGSTAAKGKPTMTTASPVTSSHGSTNTAMSEAALSQPMSMPSQSAPVPTSSQGNGFVGGLDWFANAIQNSGNMSTNNQGWSPLSPM